MGGISSILFFCASHRGLSGTKPIKAKTKMGKMHWSANPVRH